MSVSAGNPPDIINLVANWAPQIAALGALTDLRPYFSDAEIADVPKPALEDCLVDGTLYSFPNFLGTINVVAWKKLLREVGLPVAVPAHWDEFKNAVRKISDLGSDTYGFGARTDKSFNSAFWFFPVLWGHLGVFEDEQGHVVFNDQGTIDALAWYREIGTTGQTPVGEGVRAVRELQAQGHVGFIIDGPWMQGWFRALSGSNKLDDEYIAGLMPRAADGKRYGIANNHVMAVAEQSKVKEEAVAFIKFFTQNVEMNRVFHDDFGFVPINRSLHSTPTYMEDAFFAPFVEAAEYSVAVPSKNPNLSGALEFVAVAMQGALLGGDPKQAAEEAYRSIKTLYRQ
ncbi:Cyclodextrin-binding protein [subsurface metagenome]